MRQLIQHAILFPLQVLIVSDQMTFHALVLGEGPLHQQRNLAGKQRLGTVGVLELPLLVRLMKLQPLLQRQFQAAQAQVRVCGLRIPPPIPHINLVVRIHHEKVHGIVAIVIEQPDIDVVHPGDANAHVLAQLLAER